MAFDINTNIASLQAQQYLRVNSDFQSKTINRVTSGLRIISSGDDAAGLAIANGYRSDQAVLTQGIRNANDGLSTLQTIDGGMNNISQLLDRARTLATQAASGTFNGDRNLLNSEFTSLLGEINRQAQSIGLNQNGTFAKNLTVFIGGGRGATNTDVINNGSVAVDMSRSTVDSQSLGLAGVRVTNASGRDLSAGQATSVQSIVQDGNNAVTNNITNFYLAGPGFTDANRIAVAVNLSGVTDTTTLASAVNAAIQNAGNGTTAAATAFKNAGISASIYTDINNAQHLAFTSSSTAFQVEAGDKMANALMGNTTSANSADGVALATTVTGVANAGAGTLASQATVRFQGAGLTSPVDIVLASGKGITDLQNAVTASTSLAAAGITLSTATAGQKLVFTSAKGEQFTVEAAGDTANVLGLGTFQYGSGGSAVDYTTTTGAAYNTATAKGTANLEFSVNGSATAGHVVSVDTAGGDAQAGYATGNLDLTGGVTIGTNNEKLNVTVDGALQQIQLLAADATASALVTDINSKLVGATASLKVSGASTFLVITSNSKGANSSIALANGTNTALADTIGVSTPTAGVARSGLDVAAYVNQQIAADSSLQAAGLKATFGGGALTLASNNGTYFQLNAYGPAGADLGFGVAGAAYAAGNVAAATGISDYMSGGAYQTAAFGFAGISHGNDNQTITVSANDSTGTMQSKSIVLQNAGSTRNARTIDEAISTINAALQTSNLPVLQGIAAVKDNSSGEKIKFVSLKAFSVSIGTNASGNTGFTSQGTNNVALVNGTGSTAGISTQSNASNAVTALSTAVSALGSAQAVVGKGQNDFNYAINLAQSQLTNLAAAESRIRDADLAAEAANLTKAQILMQAGTAALAQANSAPQAVLALLRG